MASVGMVVGGAQPVRCPRGGSTCGDVLCLLVIGRHFYVRNSDGDRLRRRRLILFTKELTATFKRKEKKNFRFKSPVTYVGT